MSEEAVAKATERERLQIDIDEAVHVATRRIREIGWAVEGVYLALSTVPALYVMFSVGIGWGILLAIVVYLLAGAPLYRLRETQRIMTDASPEAVREQLLALDNPLTVTWLARADAVLAPTEADDDDVVAILDITVWFLFQRQIPLRISERPSGEIRIVVGDPTAGIRVSASIEREYGTTIIETTSLVDCVRLRTIVFYRLVDPIGRRFFEHYGYRVVESDRRIGLRR